MRGRAHWLNAPPAGPMAPVVPPVVVSDSFNRAASATLGTADTGQMWTAIRGGAQIVSNEAAGGGTGGLNFNDNILVLDCGDADGTASVTLPAGLNFGEGLCFRVVDYDNCWFIANGYIIRRVGGVQTNMNPLNGLPNAVGTVMRVILNGSSITLESDAYPSFWPITDSNHAAATAHGLYIAAFGSRLDDFSFVS